MIWTSYFAKMRKMTPEQQARCFSIAQYTPKGIKIRRISQLAPAPYLLLHYKEDGDQETFRDAYWKQLESIQPDAKRLTKVIGQYYDDCIFLCFEKSEDFCHRHILADWLNSYGVECKELNL